MPLSTSLLQELNDALFQRRVHDGFTLLHRHGEELARLSPSDPDASSFLLCMAHWVDVGYAEIAYLDMLIARFDDLSRATLQLQDYINLRMTEAYRDFASEKSQKAIASFDILLQMEPGVVVPRTLMLAHFWKARAHRKQGEYELALQHITEAKSAASRLYAPKLVAGMKIHESWMLFQRGQRKEALRLLDEAEAELKTTGHMLAMGNIASARGRFARRAGEYGKALAYFESAVDTYSDRYANHPNRARALVNAAYVKSLIALDLKNRSNAGRASGAHHAQYLEICRQALALLKESERIYSHNNHRAGIGTVYVNASHLHLDSGDIDRAEDEAEKAFELGRRRQDAILMSRARTLQATIQNERADEQAGEPADTMMHAELARKYSDESIELARLTQNRRLLAGAYIARGNTAASDFFQDWEMAKQYVLLATELLGKEDRDHLSRELAQLKTRILRTTGIDETLRAWSEGIVGDKTFQQLTEEFAEIVIPKVWLREDRKISRVASLLSMSPKKVRRILNNANLLKGSK